MCVVRGLGAEANGRQEGICPPYFTGLFIHIRSKLTSSAGATGRLYSHLNLEEFTTLDTDPLCLCRVIHQPPALQL